MGAIRVIPHAQAASGHAALICRRIGAFHPLTRAQIERSARSAQLREAADAAELSSPSARPALASTGGISQMAIQPGDAETAFNPVRARRLTGGLSEATGNPPRLSKI